MSSPRKLALKPLGDEDVGEGEPLLQQQSMSRERQEHAECEHDDRSPGAEEGEAAAPAELRTCRICFETEAAEDADDGNPLISPCQCSGSSRYVHRKCLEQWRHSSHRHDAFYQ